MTYDEFVKKYNGKGTDYDGTYGVQCVDLAKLYIDKVLGVKPQSIGNAYAYYDDFDKTYLKKYFDRIPYKAGVKSKKGDLVVWGKKYNGKSENGHIALATGKQTADTITTYDQNWNGKPMKSVTHKIKYIKGFLRPKDQSKIDGEKKTEKLPYVVGNTYTLLTDVNVRENAGTDSKRVKRNALTADGKKHAKIGVYATFKEGTKITCKAVKKIGKDVWIKCPSGWLAGYYNGNYYIK